MGPNKAIVRGDAIYDARTGRLIQDGLSNKHVLTDYASHHYLVLLEVDKASQPWELNGQPVYCIQGSRYETLDDHQPHLRRCADCGGMAVRTEEVTIERDCIRCTQCGHGYDARLEMMES